MRHLYYNKRREPALPAPEGSVGRPGRGLPQLRRLGLRDAVRGHLPPRRPRLQPRGRRARHRSRHRPRGRRRPARRPANRPGRLAGDRRRVAGGARRRLCGARLRAAAAAAGIGNGGLQPSQSALLASLAPPEVRHRATAVSRVASNLGIGIGGLVGGVIAAYGLGGFVALFLVNAVTYLVYAVILLVGARDDVRPAPVAGGYRVVLRDRPFVRLALINIAVIAVGWGIFSWIVPAYARGEIGVSTRLIGLLVLGNAVTVVVAQVPAAKLAEGRRRTVTMASGALIFVPACLLVVAAGSFDVPVAAAALLVAAVVVAVGECLHTTVLMPLVADLAPPALRGRYMAVIALSWWLGLALAPTVGAQLLSVSPEAAMLGSAAVALAAGLSALALEREIPTAIRLTPQPRGRASSSAA